MPPHMHGGYKMGGPGQSPGAQGYPPQQPQQYPPGEIDQIFYSPFNCLLLFKLFKLLNTLNSKY